MEPKTVGLITVTGVAGIVGYLVWKSQQKASEVPVTSDPGTGSGTPAPAPAPGGDFGIGGPGMNERIWNSWFCSQYPWLCAKPATNIYSLGVNK